MYIKWTYGSIQKYLDTAFGPLKHFYNGEEGADEDKEYVEIKIYGPRKEKLSKTETKLEVVIDFVVHVHASEKNVLRAHEIADIIDDFLGDIPIYKVGSLETDNPNVQVYCLRFEGTEPYTFLGPAEGTVRMNRGVLRAHFEQTV